jgi:hypothetical protein
MSADGSERVMGVLWYQRPALRMQSIQMSISICRAACKNQSRFFVSILKQFFLSVSSDTTSSMVKSSSRLMIPVGDSSWGLNQ